MTKILSISKSLLIKQFAVSLLLLIFVSPIKSQDIASKPKGFTGKRHSITPMFAIANNFTTPFSNSPNPSLRVRNENGEELRTPISIRYQYRMRYGIQLGADFLVNYNPMGLKPEFNTQYGYVGPLIPTDGNLLGGDFHVSKTIKVKIIEAFGYVGIGGYSQRVENSLTKDYSWFRNAPSEFYDFAVASTNNVTRKFLPITKFGIGVRLKHLEIGVNREYSLVSPVKSFTYEGVNYENMAARFKSLSFHIGYRYEF